MPLNVQKVKWDVLNGPTVSAPPGGGEGGAQAPAQPRDAATDAFAAWVLGPAAAVPRLSTRSGLQAVLFDLDGVLVDTAEFHYRGWKHLAEDLGLHFDRRMNHGFRGVGRMECLEKLLGEHGRYFAAEEKHMLAERKNVYYLELVKTLTLRDVLPGTLDVVAGLRRLPGGCTGGGDTGVRCAVVSASRNAQRVLALLGIDKLFDTVVAGGDVTRGKPDPQGFLLAAERLRVRPGQCVVVEDAEAGIRAARAAGMKSVGIGEGVLGVGADITVTGIHDLTAEILERV